MQCIETQHIISNKISDIALPPTCYSIGLKFNEMLKITKL